MEDVMRLIEEYVKEHPDVSELGGEYLSQNSKGLEDAITLIYDIFNALIP